VRKQSLTTCVLLTLMVVGCSGAMQQRYEADWESLKNHECPTWFRDAKFGIYFHWGPYSVPAYKTEWYSHYMYVPGHACNKYHLETYGPLDKFGYKDFIPMFKAEKFDPDAWATLFKKAGARFAGPVAEHADGFAMWDSDLTEWNAAKMGPKRDIVGAMRKAVRKQGMKFIATLHHQWLYAWYPTMDPKTDAGDPAYAQFYGPPAPRSAFCGSDRNPEPMPKPEFSQRWLSRATEVVDKYQPDLIWFDNKLHILDQQALQGFLAHYYNSAASWNRDVVATYKHRDFHEGAGVLDLERSRMSEGKDFPWLTDDSIDWGAWCHVQEPRYKTTNRLIDFLVDVVSKNGCVLLNITPTAEGEIPLPVQKRLLEMGHWLDLNGEAIYETRPWRIFGEGPMEIVEGHLSEHKNKDATSEEIRFTRRGNTLYATALDWPQDGVMRIRSLSDGSDLLGDIKRIDLLGHNGKLSWARNAEGLAVSLPEKRPCRHAFVLKIKAQGI
jgi:alpha-L-fucosidase